jgi:hypothetical protein
VCREVALEQTQSVYQAMHYESGGMLWCVGAEGEVVGYRVGEGGKLEVRERVIRGGGKVRAVWMRRGEMIVGGEEGVREFKQGAVVKECKVVAREKRLEALARLGDGRMVVVGEDGKADFGGSIV